jgi:hypothetical protein
MHLQTGMRGIKPSIPFETLIRWDGYPYPQDGSRVLPGTDKGMDFLPGGYPNHYLGQSLIVGSECRHQTGACQREESHLRAQVQHLP